ncbi:MAG TPA: DUF4199 domain-containing protein [Bacteroidia bacterium]|nr:DUF4199 domain-containing protein [Bacteroidia bacterium]
METNQASITKPALIMGSIAGVVCLLYSALLYMSASMAFGSLRYITYLFLAIAIFIGTKQFRDKKSGGYISYARGLGLGTLISLFASIINAVYVYIYMGFINPHIIDKILEQTQIKLANNPNMTPEIMDKAMSVTKIFATPFVSALLTIVGFVFVGFIISLIIAAILQKDKPVFETSDTQA